MFAESGPTATLNDVARAAGVGAIYRKCPDKEALLDALLDDKIDTVIQVAVDATTIDDPGSAFRTHLLGMIAVHAADRSLATVLFAPNRNERFPADRADQLAKTADGLITRAVIAGELHEGFTRQDTTVLAVMVGSIATVTRESDPQVCGVATRRWSSTGPVRPSTPTRSRRRRCPSSAPPKRSGAPCERQQP